jgi:predicted AlkP superfamily phosphohydrolase/phosphomutase
MLRFVQQGMMPAYDWSRTVAFPLPDQNGLNLTGWIRLNLMGREAQGILNSGKYHETCDRLEAVLRGLRTEGGKPVVKDVLRIARETGGPPPQYLPDLIIHWEDAASASPLRLMSPPITAHLVGMKFTGQHTPEGFFILRPRPGGSAAPDSVGAEDLHRLLVNALNA